MTSCSGSPADQYLEDYLLGRLAEAEAVQFEEHYFACPVCLAQLEALQAAQHGLRALPPQPSRAPIPWPIRLTALAAIAAMLIAVAFVFHAKHQAPQPTLAANPSVSIPSSASQPSPAPPAQATPNSSAARSVAQLADLSLPAFLAPNLRGQPGNPVFEAGMKAYAKQDCPGAVHALARVPAAEEAGTAARFYSGVCLMHDGDLPAAARTLRSVADAGDSPQQEAAVYYLAQVALASDDASAARHDLERTIALRGDFESRARAQLAHLRQSDAGR